MTKGVEKSSLCCVGFKRSLTLFFLLLLSFLCGVSSKSLLAADLVSQEVFIDQRAPNAVEARDLGLQLGEREAMQSLLQKLAPQALSREASFTDSQINSLIEDFEVFDEKQSADRYRARVIYRFKKEDLERFLGAPIDASKEVPAIVPETQVLQQESQGVLLVPVLRIGDSVRLWEEDNLWRTIWDTQDLSLQKNVMLPLGDLEDIQGVDAQRAWTAQGEASRHLAVRHKAPQGALIARAQLLGINPGSESQTSSFPQASLEIEILRDAPQSSAILDRFVVQGQKGDTKESFFKRAAQTLLHRLPEVLSQSSLKHFRQESFDVKVPFSSPQEWFDIRKVLDRLKTQNFLDSYRVRRLSEGEALVTVTLFGDESTLEQSLRTHGFSFMKMMNGDKVLELKKTPTNLSIEGRGVSS